MPPAAINLTSMAQRGNGACLGMSWGISADQPISCDQPGWFGPFSSGTEEVLSSHSPALVLPCSHRATSAPRVMGGRALRAHQQKSLHPQSATSSCADQQPQPLSPRHPKTQHRGCSGIAFTVGRAVVGQSPHQPHPCPWGANALLGGAQKNPTTSVSHLSAPGYSCVASPCCQAH